MYMYVRLALFRVCDFYTILCFFLNISVFFSTNFCVFIHFLWFLYISVIFYTLTTRVFCNSLDSCPNSPRPPRKHYIPVHVCVCVYPVSLARPLLESRSRGVEPLPRSNRWDIDRCSISHDHYCNMPCCCTLVCAESSVLCVVRRCNVMFKLLSVLFWFLAIFR